MRALLDTCVLFDIIARRMSFEDSCKLLLPQAFGDLELWVSAKSYTDIFYVMRKNFESSDIQKAFLSSFKRFNICSVDEAVLARAAELEWPDFEDCLISVCAEKMGADIIVARDAKGFDRSKVHVCAPGEVLQALEGRGISYGEVPW